MKTPFLIAAAAIPLASGIAFLPSEAVHSPNPKTVSIARPPAVRPLPSPGLYLARPYSILVLVPKLVNPACEFAQADHREPDDRFVITPPLYLEPKK